MAQMDSAGDFELEELIEMEIQLAAGDYPTSLAAPGI